MAQVKLGQHVSPSPRRPPRRRGARHRRAAAQALAEQKGKADKLGSILVRLGFISEEQLIGFLSRQYGIPSITLANLDIDARDAPAGARRTSPRSTRCCPVKRIGGTLTLAMSDPTNVFALDDIAFMTNLQILPVVAPQAAIRKAHRPQLRRPSRRRR